MIRTVYLLLSHFYTFLSGNNLLFSLLFSESGTYETTLSPFLPETAILGGPAPTFCRPVKRVVFPHPGSSIRGS